jgi:glycerol uptake facilitator-like aquaporin
MLGAPVGSRRPRNKRIAGASWQNTDGQAKDPKSFVNNLLYAPYGKGQMGKYAPEIASGMIKELVAVIIICFLLPCFVSTAPGADPVSRAIFVGLIASLSIYATLKWGYNDRLPRNLTPGATIAELFSGRINLGLALMYLIVGFVGAIVAAALLYATGSSSIPVIGYPNGTSTVAVAFIQLCFTAIIALTVYDQKYIRQGQPRVFKKRSTATSDMNQTENNPTPNRAFQEDIGARPSVYAAFVMILVAGAYLKWGLWAFNAYIYFAGGFGLRFLGDEGAFANVITVGSANPPTSYSQVDGAWAIFLFMDIAAWLCAMCIEAGLYRLNGMTERTSDDDSSGYAMETESSYRAMDDQPVVESQITSKQASTRKRRDADIQAHLSQDGFDAKAWK